MTFMWREKSEAGKRKSHLLALVSIAAAGMICYLPVLNDGFLRYDDYGLLVNNPLVRDPSWQGLARIFSEFYASNYQPVVLILFRCLYSLFGLNEPVFHLVPLLFHAVNSCLLYLILNRVRVSQRASVVCSLLFSLHPLRVEAVAWVYAGFSYTISAFFFLAAILSYLTELNKKEDRAYVGWPTLVLFSLAVLSKAVAIVLPLALYALDFLLKRPLDRRRLIEKAPLLGLAGIWVLIMTWAQHAGGATSVGGDFATWERLVIPIKALSYYVAKTLWPVGLSVLVPYPTHGHLLSVTSYAGLLLLLIPWIAWFVAADHRRPILFGILWYLVCILPVLRLIPIGHSLVGDRYSYLPALGLSIGVGVIVSSISLKMRGISLVGLSALTILFATVSWNQVHVWNNDLSLWRHAVTIAPDSVLTRTHWASALSISGRLDEAENEFRALQGLAPHLPNGDFGLGKIYGQRGEFEKSVQHFQRAIELDSDRNEAYMWLGVSLCGLGQWEAAHGSFQKAKALGGEVPLQFFQEASRHVNGL